VGELVKIVTQGVGGNLHDAAEWINRYDLGDYFVNAWSSGFNSIVILKVPDDFNLSSHVGKKLNPKKEKP
jgi:hypothetical protein